ncbi:NADH:ubiquinone oxidoreductase [Thiocapsa imhoffii]|uniref:NADH:ubiquinone oxidoreductase n=1 Tax=Thiocapsa imhoffii TaxID=382777 RepID=A0A9X1B9W1_9GAMM|nr:CIA30 family protein [Thiocapsa imhoffii]MBK1646292.1 NADH:ubiquinone oxidoreductase [Thiocapsa imhoffii]
MLGIVETTTAATTGLIDDFTRSDGLSALGTPWRAVTDQVMGGRSQASISRETQEGRPALCLNGDVRLENNGGFVQAILELPPSDDRVEGFDASGYAGIQLWVRGNGELYNLHLKSTTTRLPWQSYRASFVAEPEWREVRLPFSAFEPHRLVQRLDPRRLTKLGVLGIGRAYQAQVCIAEVRFYR